ncbi:hypothetical protein GGI04_000008 [Coemansia thaxteri]|uniref:TLC domain-containing protein n=1 Tax=Coemansia thaxteri TaxID=2663907 RepID=A0A9W8EGS1_9FUNG|nr:hypothetical protein H4R26_004420 [Coemansia thaxteri]KAJ2009909.1 hypothetical protein GGI04_000008 [Coemansia thaxteri]KAJ2474305.1 hypothetical protein GGI02_000198 [Coemansia sp. RSA 2322]KAJ2484192.1 hypothetical protein EV174_002631 [Coemansia sp. RSA 2320]
MEVAYNFLVNNSVNEGFFNAVGLPRLATYWPQSLLIALLFQLIYQFSAVLTPAIFPKTWGRLSKVQRYKWCVRKVSSCHAAYMVTNALVIIANAKLRANPIHGSDPFAESAFTVTLGYFLWDIVNTYRHLDIDGVGYLAHAIMSFGVYLISYSPLLQYYGACFMMFEVSTIFLNIHMTLDDMDLKDAIMYFINGMALVSSFFFARVVYGTILSINVWKGLASSSIPVSSFAANFVRLANIVLMSLSYYWFSVIIMTAKRNALDADLIRALDEMDKTESKTK